MNGKLLNTIFGFAAIVGIMGFIAYQSKLAKDAKCNPPPGVVFFYGVTCPHCKNVEKYFDEENVRQKYNFKELEVYNDKNNRQMLTEAAKCCQMDVTKIGVPFLWTAEKTCVTGDQPIIDYFKNKLAQ